MPTNVDPFNHQWVTGDLAAMAARVEAGEPAATLRQQLFETLWPWATQMADREVRRLPARADGDETRSQLLGAVWQATQRIDWSNYGGWPSLLRRRLLGARMDAARTDDPLSRRHRQAFTRCLTAIAAEEQARGRRLAATERDAVAATIFPSSASRPGLLAELAELASSHEAAGDASWRRQTIAGTPSESFWTPSCARRCNPGFLRFQAMWPPRSSRGATKVPTGLYPGRWLSWRRRSIRLWLRLCGFRRDRPSRRSVPAPSIRRRPGRGTTR